MGLTLTLPTPAEIQDFTSRNQVESFAGRWKIIPLNNLKPSTQNIAHRLNSFGSSYYFAKVILRKRRFQDYLHKDWCELIEQSSLKEVIEIPRDHFKSTIFSECAPVWWALPFTDNDEKLMRQLGYGDEWIRWMRRAHNQNTRTLLVSENIKNACKLGRRINHHYRNNDLFKRLFPEIIPDSSCNWSVETMTHKRIGAGAEQGEGTYDYLGVDGALQSRHYERVIEDDLVGKDALGSTVTMMSTIDYHKLLVGAFDADPLNPDVSNDEIVVGNRWAYNDLNSYIRKNEKTFRITNHSAEGGCCEKHPAGKPIFPDEQGANKLAEWRERLGVYYYSCQFLNKPVPPGQNKFQEKWLNYYNFLRPRVDVMGKQAVKIVHEIKNQNPNLTPTDIVMGGASIIPDLFPHTLSKVMVADPNHAGNEGRSRHAICITGTHATEDRLNRIYLLECYANNSSHNDFVNKIFELAEKWKMREIHLETIAAQRWIKYLLETENARRYKLGKWRISDIIPLKVSNTKDAKVQRIEAVEPVYARGEFWIPRGSVHGSEQFLAEYTEYPYCSTRDILDVIGYSAELWNINNMPYSVMRDKVQRNYENFKNRTVNNTGY